MQGNGVQKPTMPGTDIARIQETDNHHDFLYVPQSFSCYKSIKCYTNAVSTRKLKRSYKKLRNSNLSRM